MRRYRRRRVARPFRSRRARTGRVSRRVRTARIRRYRRYQVHHFTRHCEKVALAGQNSVLYAPYLSFITFQLSDLPAYSEFTALYDQYKINCVVLSWKLMNAPEAQGMQYNASNYPEIIYCYDYDTNAPASTLNQIRERGNCKQKILRPNSYMKMVIRPKITTPVFNGALSFAYAVHRPSWIDCTNASVPHFGIQYAIDNFQNPNYVLTVEAKYYVSFRNTQ